MSDQKKQVKPSSGNGRILTVAALAEAKQLPVEYLQQLGLRDTPRGVSIPYYGFAGEVIAVKTRTAIIAKEGGYWPKGVELAAYGSERIGEGKKAALFIVEGESDCWVLWHYGLLALGIPGANATKVILSKHVEAIGVVYVVVEPDKGGETFLAGVQARLAALNFKGNVLALRLPNGVKDPADLHVADPKKFLMLFQRAVTVAKPVVIETTAAEWQSPIPLDEVPEVPAFPVDRLPDWLKQWVIAEAEATQTPPDLAALLVLAEIGAAIARKFRVQIRNGYTEPTNIFTVAALQVGERKSAVFSDAIEAVHQHEREEQERMAPLIAEAASERRIVEARLKGAEAKAAKETDATERQLLRHEAKQLAKELETLVVPESPVLVCDDETPESLGRLLAGQGGRMLVAAAEGTTFDIAKGRYSEMANFDVFLKGHAGDELRVGRVSRDREHITRPALSMALAVQPDVIRGLAENATMRQRGFLARFAYSIPRSKVGHRTIGPRPVPAPVAKRFRETMLALWRLEGPASQGREYIAHVLQFSPDADAVLRELEKWLEPKLAEGEELSHLAGWAQKLAGLVARLSAILHMAGAIGTGVDWNTPLTVETVEAAVVIGRDYLLLHAKAAFNLMGADPRVSKAKDVWHSIVKRVEFSENSEDVPTISLRDLHQWNRRSFTTADDVPAVAKILCDFGYLREQEGSGRPGRGSKSPVYLVNPLALAATCRNMDTRTHCTHCTHSANETGVSEDSEDSEYAPVSPTELMEEGEL